MEVVDRLDELFETEDISAVMAQETNEVEEPELSAPIQPTEPLPPSVPTPSENTPQGEEKKPYNAAANAASLVYGLQAIEQILLNPVAIVKVRKDVGGKEVLDKMRAAVTKEYSGLTLDDNDLRLLKGFAAYKKNMDILSGSLITSKKETDKMIEVALGYCEENQFNVGKGLAFWATFTGSFVEKITTIAFL